MIVLFNTDARERGGSFPNPYDSLMPNCLSCFDSTYVTEIAEWVGGLRTQLLHVDVDNVIEFSCLLRNVYDDVITSVVSRDWETDMADLCIEKI